MKHSFSLFIIIAAILQTIISCGPNNSKRILELSGNVLNINYDNPQYVNLDSLIAQITFVPLESKEESNVIEATQIYVDGSQIIVFDMFSSIVKSFDKKGRYIGDIGSRGQGPGEYAFVSSISVDDNVIYVEDYKNKILEFSKTDLKLIKETKVEKTPASIRLTKDRWAVMNSINEDYQIDICDNDWNIIKRFVSMEVQSGHQEWPSYRFFAHNNSVFAFPFHDNGIYYVNEDTVQLIKIVTYGKYDIIPNDLYQVRSENNQLEVLKKDDKYVINYNHLENDTHFITSFNRGKKFFLGVYNKEMAKTDLYVNDNDDLAVLDFIFYPSTTFENSFVSFSNVEKLKLNPYCSKNLDFQKMCDTISDESDILVFWNIKNCDK